LFERARPPLAGGEAWAVEACAHDRTSWADTFVYLPAVVIDGSPRRFLESLACYKFVDQLDKWRIPAEWISDARLDIRWSGNAVEGFVNGSPAMGSEVTLIAS
jgi:hypothetical protein